MSPLLVILALVATFRLTVAVTTDRITQTVRRKIAGWEPVEGDATWEGVGEDVDLTHIELARRPKLGYLVKCDWCSSFWLSPLPATAAVLWPTNRLVWGVLVALAASAVTGLLSTVVGLVLALEGKADAEKDVMSR